MSLEKDATRADHGEILVKVEGVSKKFCRDLKKSLWYGIRDVMAELNPVASTQSTQNELRSGEFWANRGISFELRKGECLGLIGHNGAGKTTLLKMLNGLIKPDQGQIEIRGRVGALIALGAGFNPILTGRENIYINGSILGLTIKEINEKMEEIIDFSEIGDFIDAPVQSYSSGMIVRLGFSIATALEPDVLILDEILAVGDVAFRAKCMKRMGQILDKAAVILVSHESHAISRYCDRAVLLDHGCLVFDGHPDEGLLRYENLLRKKRSVYDLEMLEASLVSKFTLLDFSEVVSRGGELRLQFELHVTAPFRVDNAVMNLIDRHQNVHGQVVLSFSREPLGVGVHLLTLKTGPLYLSGMRLGVALLISTQGGKVPVISFRNSDLFQFEGVPNCGPVYYPPSEVECQYLRDI